MGPAGLTAVFGMGTGVTPPVWSPEKWPAGDEAGPVTNPRIVAHEATHMRMSGVALHDSLSKILESDRLLAPWGKAGHVLQPLGQQERQRPDRGGQAAWLLGPVG